MIGLDTNILVRFLALDDPAQIPKARAIVDSLTVDEPGWVSSASLLELVWVFTSSFGADRVGFVLFSKNCRAARESSLKKATHFGWHRICIVAEELISRTA